VTRQIRDFTNQNDLSAARYGSSQRVLPCVSDLYSPGEDTSDREPPRLRRASIARRAEPGIQPLIRSVSSRSFRDVLLLRTLPPELVDAIARSEKFVVRFHQTTAEGWLCGVQSKGASNPTF